MSEEIKETKIPDAKQEEALDRREFFLDELAAMDLKQERMYNYLARRVTILEQKGKSMADDPEKMIGSIILVLAMIQLIPLVIDWITRCRLSSQSLSSLE
jgi:hypothetical protein